jgi:hypothetical protein
MKYLMILIPIWISLQVSGQKTSKTDLLGCWTSSREENIQGSNVFIFRPCDYIVFPKSWFRSKIVLKDDSICSWLVLAPDDGHYMVDGNWTFNESTNELKLLTKEGREHWKCIIVEVNDTILKVKN